MAAPGTSILYIWQPEGSDWEAAVQSGDEMHTFPFLGEGDTQVRLFAQLCQQDESQLLIDNIGTILDLGDMRPDLAYGLAGEALWPESAVEPLSSELEEMGVFMLEFL
ncbi:hypothetical protein N7530_011446 [Penicillium desertorum]|uniref:Uncharacterized protein n=1 Tax=Penicillium desertorum TaxID=1303715 RepID=A0A9W9WDS9_9EURO|nr:hypothetical protein N7530_011446 [Penicillium desertorum]